MQSFDQCLQIYYSQGLISYQDAVAYASNPEDFALMQTGVVSDSSTITASSTSAEAPEEEIDIERLG